MKIIDIIEYDISNYKEASMFIITSTCSFKCDKENGTKLCQNGHLAKSEKIELDDDIIVKKYLNNPMTTAIVFGGLEPLDQFDELILLIAKFRKETSDTIVIYTGYNEDEVPEYINKLAAFKNIIVKFGRFIPNQEKHFDEVLGIELASNNQYAKVLKKMKVRIVDNKEIVEKIDAGLAKNKEKYGEAYCPCRLKHIPENICMCKEFRDQLTPGPCHCGKFEKYYE